MVHNMSFLAFALKQGLDVGVNTNSNYYNSRATRIAYFKWVKNEQT